MTQLSRVAPDEPDVAALLKRHFELMRMQSPPESCHVLPADALRAPDIHLFALRKHGNAVAVGALRVFGAMAELKSMHTAERERGNGYGRVLLKGLIQEALRIGVSQLALETGSGAEHETARYLYASEGFRECPPFGDYTYDPLSLFMSKTL